ncbi:MAG: Crp/Fnr family transcriptional regulator, partial [Chitinophagaceae bacterium]|nr:Crp/Fnr family transcriptional regulator [Chitinophagaceae bacterium]
MFDVLYQYLAARMELTQQQLEFIETLLIPKTLRKGEILIREGEVCRFGTFVTQGCLRSYVVDDKGKEHVVQFAPETWWLTDLQSLATGEPTLYFIDAIEDSEIILLKAEAHGKLMKTIPGFANAFQSGQHKHVAAKDKRIIASLVATAEERFQNFLDKYPSIAQRVPQHMLASYLGVTPETISRI